MEKYKIYIELDENNCIRNLLSTAFYTDDELINRGCIYLDEISINEDIPKEMHGHYIYSNYLEMKYGKPMNDEKMIPNYKSVDNTVIELQSEEKQELFIKPQRIQAEKEKQKNMLENMMIQAQKTAFLIDLSDAQAATIPYCYPEWESFIDKPLLRLNDQGKENRVQYNGKLHKVKQDIPIVLRNQPPGIETASLYEVIDIKHKGTLDDPIPYDMNMAVYNNKYYIEDELIYLCILDSGIPLYASCASLIGIYFKLIE